MAQKLSKYREIKLVWQLFEWPSSIEIAESAKIDFFLEQGGREASQPCKAVYMPRCYRSSSQGSWARCSLCLGYFCPEAHVSIHELFCVDISLLSNLPASSNSHTYSSYLCLHFCHCSLRVNITLIEKSTLFKLFSFYLHVMKFRRKRSITVLWFRPGKYMDKKYNLIW